MGEFHRLKDKPVRKHKFVATLPIKVRSTDIDRWEEAVKDWPDSWFARVTAESGDFSDILLSYEARSANTHDITRKLDLTDLKYTPGKPKRDRVCSCGSDVKESESCGDLRK